MAKRAGTEREPRGDVCRGQRRSPLQSGDVVGGCEAMTAERWRVWAGEDWSGPGEPEAAESEARVEEITSRWRSRSCCVRLFFLGGEPVGEEEADTEMEAEGSEMMTSSTGS